MSIRWLCNLFYGEMYLVIEILAAWETSNDWKRACLIGTIDWTVFWIKNQALRS